MWCRRTGQQEQPISVISDIENFISSQALRTYTMSICYNDFDMDALIDVYILFHATDANSHVACVDLT